MAFVESALSFRLNLGSGNAYDLHGALKDSHKNDDNIDDDADYPDEKQASWLKRRLRSICTKKAIFNTFPILTWLPKYTPADAIGDLIAGVTVGLLVIPQSLAFAGIAGVDPQHGLYGAFFGSFVYAIFGTCSAVAFAPTSTASLMTFVTAGGSVFRSTLLAFIAGCIHLVMGIFGLGFLLNYVSTPVGSGFLNAMALIVVTSQIKHIFGIQAIGRTFIQTWTSVFENIQNYRIGDTILGISCIIILMAIKKFGTIRVGPKEDSEKTRGQRAVNKAIWLFATSRNAIIVLLTAGISAHFLLSGENYFIVIGKIPTGMPHFTPPPFSIPEIVNETTNEVIQPYESFIDMVSYMGAGLLITPLIGLMETLSIGKAFSEGKKMRVNQELIALGVGNVLNSFVQGYPANGGLSRSAVNHASGVRTPFGGFYTGIMVILAILFLTPYFFYIPKAALGGVIITAAIAMINFGEVKVIWRSRRSEIIPWTITFIACLSLRLDIGLLVAVGVNLLTLLWQLSSPKVTIEKRKTLDYTDYLLVVPDRSLVFPSAEKFRNKLNKMTRELKIVVVIDCTHVFSADFTAAKSIEQLLKDFAKRQQSLFFYNVKPTIVNTLQVMGISFLVYYDRESLENAINSAKLVESVVV